MEEGEAEGAIKLEFTPTWIVAVVCSIIVFISLIVERLLHYLGKFLRRKSQKSLFEALQKVKEELMLLGFISLLLTVFQGTIVKICISKEWTGHLLPCKEDSSADLVRPTGGKRRLLSSRESYCDAKYEVPLLSVEALHQLHIFIFVLAITHVVYSVLTMVLAGLKIREWKHWEDSIKKNDSGSVPRTIAHVHQFEFIRDHFMGIGKDSEILSWLHSFGKQFYGSVSKSDYTTMRLGFIMTHCGSNPKFNFHKYMVRALEADFKKVVGISWYLWIFVVVFLLLNVSGWHTYFWIAFIPLILLLAVGTKLEHVISQLAHEVAEKHSAIEGDLVVKPSDDHFWLHRPKIVLYLIHFILFQNAFEISFFFWILTTYGSNSCIMERMRYIVPRLVIGLIIQILCSYSTLPLYAIVTQMGSSFKKAIFEEHVQLSLIGWAHKVRKRKVHRGSEASSTRSGSVGSKDQSSRGAHLQKLDQDDLNEDGRVEPQTKSSTPLNTGPKSV
ncbi:MLO-like protein 1 [Dendrobium catenatum]|uniref:MLO-like protein n=1 Tax=Dendrobium catenatum TaxID=906689 RepID=A0A2I0VBS8_9ASPA|nr:MLO-like protein 1 [Dendrobium catenatum]PKU60865.1 MLO-like protein 1 [Dendrobium catenatum]